MKKKKKIEKKKYDREKCPIISSLLKLHGKEFTHLC